MARQKGRDVTGIPCDGKQFFTPGSVVCRQRRCAEGAGSRAEGPGKGGVRGDDNVVSRWELRADRSRLSSLRNKHSDPRVNGFWQFFSLISNFIASVLHIMINSSQQTILFITHAISLV